MSFQKSVYLGIPMGWDGDRVSTNPIVTLVSQNGGWQAGAGGIKAGTFVWRDPSDTTQRTLLNSGTGSPVGFVGRDLTGMVQNYLEEASMMIPEGFMVAAYVKGDFLITLPETVSNVAVGEAVYVDPTNGQVTDSQSKDAVETNFTYLFNATGGQPVKISSYI